MNDAELVKATRKLFAKHVMSDRLTDEQILTALRPEPAPSIEQALMVAVNKDRVIDELPEEVVATPNGRSVETNDLALNSDALEETLKRKLGIRG